MEDMLKGALSHLDGAAKYTKVHPEVLEKLQYPKEVMSARLFEALSLIHISEPTRPY